MTTKATYEALVSKYDEFMQDCLSSAKAAFEQHRESDYHFWMQQYKVNFDARQHYFVCLLNLVSEEA